MKILHINSYYSYSKFFKNLYDNQVSSGLDIDVFVPVSSDAESNDFDYGSYSAISRNHNKYDRYFFHLKHNKICKDIQRKYNIEKYDAIHAHSLFSNGYIAMKLKEKYGTPYIVAVRNTDINLFFKKMIHLRKLGVKILKDANQVVFLSEPYKDLVIERYVPESLKEEISNRVTILPNGIDKFWFDNIGVPKEEPKLPCIRLLQVGDINKNKNIETTVKAVDLLIEKGYLVELNVVGKVKDEDIFNKIKDLEYVNYLGYKSKQELLTIYRENDIFVLPSIHETFGLVYAEAMSQGLPVIYTRGQGFDKQFEDGEVGYVVYYSDFADITLKIEETISNYRSITKNVIESVHKFSWDNIVLRYIYLYKQREGNKQ